MLKNFATAATSGRKDSCLHRFQDTNFAACAHAGRQLAKELCFAGKTATDLMRNVFGEPETSVELQVLIFWPGIAETDDDLMGNWGNSGAGTNSVMFANDLPEVSVALMVFS